MVDEFMTAYGSRLVIAVVGVGIGFLLLIGILYLIRRRSGPSPFLRGGKNRQPRLQVLDAAAVDARRRIVLIRRDNVEHLVMIGGPTDIVIESGIGAARDGETLDRPPVETLQIAPQPAEPRLTPPAQQPRIAETKHEAPAMNPVAGAEPSRQMARSVQVQGNEMMPPVKTPSTAKSAEKASPTPATPPTARPEVVEPVILTEAPELRAVTETAKQQSPQQPIQVPDVGAAADALDAARRRVFQPALDRTPPSGPKPDAGEPSVRFEKSMPPQPVAGTAELENEGTKAEPQFTPEKPRSLGSDFDRILEEEMASKLSAQQPDSAKETFTPVLPRRDPANPKVTGATPEPTLQNEIARIFGEMSVTRNDR